MSIIEENPDSFGFGTKVTCRACHDTYVLEFLGRGFYLDSEDDLEVGVCDECFRREEESGTRPRDPYTITIEHADRVCLSGKGATRCVFLTLDGRLQEYQCAKGSNEERIVRARSGHDTVNCSGPPDFTIPMTPMS